MEYSLSFEYEKAVAVFKKLLKEGFDNREVNDLIISNLMKNRKYDEALKHFGSYKLRQKLKTHDYYTLGGIYFGLKKYKEAIKNFNKAIHSDYQNVQYIDKRGLCYAAMGAHEFALKDFNTAIYYNPDYLPAYLHRGNSKISLNDLEGGLADIQHVIEFDDEIPQSYVYLGQYYRKKHDYSMALKSFEKAQQLHADHHGLEFFIEESKSYLEKDDEN